MTKSRFDSVLDMIGREAGATHRSIIEFLLASVSERVLVLMLSYVIGFHSHPN